MLRPTTGRGPTGAQPSGCRNGPGEPRDTGPRRLTDQGFWTVNGALRRKATALRPTSGRGPVIPRMRLELFRFDVAYATSNRYDVDLLGGVNPSTGWGIHGKDYSPRPALSTDSPAGLARTNRAVNPRGCAFPFWPAQLREFPARAASGCGCRAWRSCPGSDRPRG